MVTITLHCPHCQSEALVRDQIEVLLRSFPVAAIKTGLLFSAEIVAEVARTLEAFGRIDILVNAAGVTGPVETPVQDIAVVAPEDVPAARIEVAVREGGGELLDRVRVFDLYRGEQVGEGNRSLALRLEFRSPERTLTDEDVAALREAIEARLAEIGGRLRA